MRRNLVEAARVDLRRQCIFNFGLLFYFFILLFFDLTGERGPVVVGYDSRVIN